MAIWQDLVTDHGFAAKYASVMRFVVKLRGRPTPEARVVIHTRARRGGAGRLRRGADGAGPGDGQVPSDAALRLHARLQPQVGAAARFKSSSRIWAELHERAFRRLGGAPRVVVLDNLREGVLKPDIYDPTLNPLYADVLRHYGVDGAAVPRARSRPQGEGGIRRRARADERR